MHSRLTTACLLAGIALLPLGCKSDKPAGDAASTAKPQFNFAHINPNGANGVAPTVTGAPAEVTKTFEYIDQHIDEHVNNLQKWIQQPSISNSGEGIPESAEMVKGFLDKLGCQTTKVYDPGITEYGTPGNPIVYGKCDEGAPKTVAFWWQLDTMPVTQPDNWVSPPFEARIVSGKDNGVPQYSRVLVGRGASNSKGPVMTQLNALMAYKAVNGKLPVNLIIIGEMDEERMDIGLRQFIKQHSDLLAEADALYAGGPSEGCVYVELTTSGKSWGRGPTVSDIHGVNKRTADSPAWRHITMLSKMISDDGNTPKIKGWEDGKVEPTPEQVAELKKRAEHMDLKKMAENTGLARYKTDDPYKVAYDGRFGDSFNLDGIWGGNMYAGGAGAILPNKITSKHNFRYVPNMDGMNIVKKLREQLDANGYKDVELKLVGDVPWSKGSSPDADISVAHRKAAAMLGLSGPGQDMFASNADHYEKDGRIKPLGVNVTDDNPTGGYWPSYLFSDGPVGQKVGTVSIPMGMGARGGAGGRAHAANEYWVVEGSKWSDGMAGAEKLVVASIWEYAQTTTSTPKPKTTAK